VNKTHKLLNLIMVFVLLLALDGAMGSKASYPNNSEAGFVRSATAAGIGANAGTQADTEIIPPDRRIEWSHVGIPGGIPARTTVCAMIDSAVYGNGITDATGAIQDAIDRCPDEQVVYLPEGTYIVHDTIHIYSYDTLRGAGQGKTITTRNNAIEIAAKNTYMNVVGSVLGTPGKSNRYEVLPGQPYDD
jgi:polygalacturonase